MRIILRTMDLPGKSAALYRPRKSPIGIPQSALLIVWMYVLLVILDMTESKMIVHHFGPPPDGYTPGQHWVTQIMKQVPKRNRCKSTQKGEQKFVIV